MRYLCDHSSDCRSIYTIHDLVEALESQAFYDPLMLIGRSDRAAKILDLQCCIGFASGFLFRCHFLQFLDLSSAQFGDFNRLLELLQTVKSGLNHIMWIGTAQ
jgi:hypothetical protein